MPRWIAETFRKYPWAEFCLTCGHFIVHRRECPKYHIVLRNADWRDC